MYLDLARKLTETVEHEVDGDTNFCGSSRNSPQKHKKRELVNGN